MLETMLLQLRLGDLGVLAQTAGEESDDMAIIVPAIDDFHHVGKNLCGRHPFGLLIGYVLTHGTIDVDEEILASLGEGGAYCQPSLIGCLNQLYHGRCRPRAHLLNPSLDVRGLFSQRRPKGSWR